MRRDEQDVGVVPEDRLRPVAVVDVPVDDGDALAATAQRRRDDRDVVQQTESHGVIAQRVVTRWSHGDETDGVAMAFHLVDDRETGAGRQLGDRPRVIGRVGVGVERAATLVTEGAETFQVLGVVHAREFRARRAVGRGQYEFVTEV